MSVVLTCSCMMRCAYCFQTNPDPSSMAWEVLQKSADLLLEHGADDSRLGLTGGEPLLALPLIRTLVGYLDHGAAGRNGPTLTIATNGVLFDRRAARFLASRQLEVRLSFDGLAQNLRAPNTFEQLEDMVLRLRHTEPVLFHERLTVIFTLTSANVALLAVSVAYLLELGLPSIEVFPISTHDPGWTEKTTDELDRQWAKVIELSLRHRQRTGAVPIKMLQDRPTPAPLDAPLCSAVRGTNLLVDVDGSVYGCTMLARSYQCLPEPWQQRLYRSDAPHIMDPDVLDRLSSAAERACESGLFHHRDHKHSDLGHCADCPAINGCMTCPVATVHIPGNTDPHRVPLNQCAFNRVVHAHRDRFPARPSAVDILTGDAPVPTAMSDILR